MHTTRTAIIRPSASRPSIGVVERYMPTNYSATERSDGTYEISGTDAAGWTMDYVIDRLASGMIFAQEVVSTVTADPADTSAYGRSTR